MQSARSPNGNSHVSHGTKRIRFVAQIRGILQEIRCDPKITGQSPLAGDCRIVPGRDLPVDLVTAIQDGE